MFKTIEEIEARRAEIRNLLDSDDCDVEALEEEVRQLDTREAEIRAEIDRKKELRNRVAAGSTGTVIDQQEGVDERAHHAEEFAKTGSMRMKMFDSEQRSVLVSSGKLATPRAVDSEIGDLPSVISSIVDDVDVIDATGTGSWEFPYKTSDAAAAAVTEGSTIGGTGAAYDKVTINPSEYGVLDEVSRQVRNMTPVAYENSVRNSAYLALRKKAKNNIVTKLKASSIIEKRYSVALDKDFVRDVVLNFGSDETVGGGTKLYISRADLITLGKIRGTNEKKAVFDIDFIDENNGTIKDGGTAMAFSILSDLSSGEMLYGQPKAIKLLLWGDYEVATDEGGDFFKRNVIGVRGLVTAGADLTVYHGMQLISTGAAPEPGEH